MHARVKPSSARPSRPSEAASSAPRRRYVSAARAQLPVTGTNQQQAEAAPGTAGDDRLRPRTPATMCRWLKMGSYWICR
jgi:hypothetical protein